MSESKPFWRADLVYSLTLFVVAAATMVWMIADVGILQGEYGWEIAVFFIGFGLFTIAAGYPHPGFGHVSFDRVAQASTVLIFGPVDAAWINGLASMIYPWHRLWNGVPFRTVLLAALNNSGLMTLVVLLSGTLYMYLGGPVPLMAIDLRTAGLLLLLMLLMQFINNIGMMVILWLRNVDVRSLFNTFTTIIESASVLVAVVVAIAFTSMPTTYFVMLLVVLGIGMVVIKNYALMRQRLEALVEERTEELRVQAVEFERQATHDKLTGLPNRRYADDFLERQIELARRHDQKVTVALADIDHFKQINDRFSHAVGDEVLKRVADLLNDRCRKSDVVARYGGEEFLLCFPDTDVEFADQVCNQIRQAVENADWSDLEGADGLRVTISIGVAEARADSRATTILSEADSRLYRAKDEGRNRVVATL